VQIALPPLRERPEDLEPLVAHLVKKHADGRKITIDRGTLTLLARAPWPGNVRQLENELRRALVLCEDCVLPEHLSPGLAQVASEAADPFDLKAQIDALERKLIRKALESSRGNQTQAARLLGVSRFGLQKMIRRLGTAEQMT
jgi:DNA-binding NtrC family response regulator